jgi:hypothetical protein
LLKLSGPTLRISGPVIRLRCIPLLGGLYRSKIMSDDCKTWTHDGDHEFIYDYLIECANGWDPNARILGNARAGDVVSALIKMKTGRGNNENLTFEGIDLVSDNGSNVVFSLVCKTCGTTAKHGEPPGAMKIWCAWCNKDRMHGYVAIRVNPPNTATSGSETTANPPIADLPKTDP